MDRISTEDEAAATFVIDGEVFSMQSQPGSDRYGECLCCRPRGHVFCFGVHLPSVRALSHDGPGNVSDWLQKVLYAHRFEGGRAVRLTLELLEAEPVPVLRDMQGGK